MMNLPNFEISQVYKSFVAWVAAGSIGLVLILNVRTTQPAVAPAWPQDFTMFSAVSHNPAMAQKNRADTPRHGSRSG
jgi:hypothetical protein